MLSAAPAAAAPAAAPPPAAAAAAAAARPNVESRLMHTHNSLFQAQLKAMHWLVEEQKKSQQGYQYLERALAGGPYDDHETTRRGKKRPAASPYAAATEESSLGSGMGEGSEGVYGLDEDSVGGSYTGRRGSSTRSRRGPAPPVDMSLISAASRGRGAKRPPQQRKQPELCVQCDLRPILCRSLCNGCYQKWHKVRKAAVEQGLPEVPCPSIAILEARKAAAVAAAEAAAATAVEGGGPAATAAAPAGAAQQEEGAAAAEAAPVGGGSLA